MRISADKKFDVKLFFVISLFLSSCAGCFAFKTEGYIITLNSDTIYGSIQLSHFNQVTGAYILVAGGNIINGIETESFHSRVVFKEEGMKRFRTYFPEMILGFGFRYNSIGYVYQRIIVHRKSIIKREQQQYRFMRLICQNEDGDRYKDVRMTPNPGLQSNEDKYLKYNTHFFRIRNNKIQNTEKNDSLKSL